MHGEGCLALIGAGAVPLDCWKAQPKGSSACAPSELEILVERVGRERHAELGGIAAVEAAHDHRRGAAEPDRRAHLELVVAGEGSARQRDVDQPHGVFAAVFQSDDAARVARK